jgi:ribosomal protein S27AE
MTRCLYQVDDHGNVVFLNRYPPKVKFRSQSVLDRYPPKVKLRSQSVAAARPMVLCPRCGCSVREARLSKHLRIVHGET